jgi:hypothetical protein
MLSSMGQISKDLASFISALLWIAHIRGKLCSNVHDSVLSTLAGGKDCASRNVALVFSRSHTSPDETPSTTSWEET